MLSHVGFSKFCASGFVGLGAVLLVTSAMSTVASAAGTGPTLGTAGSFGVLAGAGVTNTGPTVVAGDLGTCPTADVTGFPPGVVGGTIHANDAAACGAQADTTIAYNNAAGRAPTQTFGGPTDLGGLTLSGGVYATPTSFAITGTLTLDGAGNPDATFIFQAGSTVITATNSSVVFVNGAQACNVFWQVGSSATLGVGSQFKGTILALSSITANTNAAVDGRLLARNGAVTLDSNRIAQPVCAAATTTSGPSSTTTPGGPTTTGATSTTTPGGPTTTGATSTTTPGGPTTTGATSTTTTAGPTTTTTAGPTSTTATTATTAAPTTTTTRPTATTATTAGPTVTTANPQTSGNGVLGPVFSSPGPSASSGTTAIDQTGRITELPRTGGTPAWLPLAGLAAMLLGAGLHGSTRRPRRLLSDVPPTTRT